MDRSGSLVLLISVFLVAVSSLIYELVVGAVGSYLMGNSITQFSLVIGLFLTAMGIGSYLTKFITKNLLLRFLQIEIAVGVLGGCSAAVLFAFFTYTQSYFAAMVMVAGGIGCLIGFEIPLIIRILREGEESLRLTVSNVMTLDYVGALAASLMFPFLLVPHLGLMRSSFLFGLLNLAVAWMGIVYFKERLAGFSTLKVYAAAGTIVVGSGFLFSGHAVSFMEEKIYPDEIIYARQTPYQRIILTKWRDDLRLFLDGKLQFSSKDEYRYHESLIHPAMSLAARRDSVLILGGGDGMAAREILKYKEVKSIDLVDFDPEMTRLFRDNDFLAQANSGSLRDPRVKVVNLDAMKYLEECPKTYDVIIMDLPDPNDLTLGKLYTRSFFTLVGRRLDIKGALSVQSSSPFFAADAFWCIVNTVADAPVAHAEDGKFHVRPYHVNVPSFGEWGFTLASPSPIDLSRLDISVPTRFLDERTMAAMFDFPRDMSPRQTEINRLDNQVLVQYYNQGYKEFNQ